MYVLVFAWTRKTQILGRCNQRLSRKLSNPQFLLIVYQFHLTVLCLLPELHRISRPLLKLSGGHFLFQVAGIVRFIRAIVCEPDTIWDWQRSRIMRRRSMRWAYCSSQMNRKRKIPRKGSTGWKEYLSGKNAPKNPERAAEYVRMAAERGNP